MKKVVSLLISLIMIFSTAVTAFADNNTVIGNGNVVIFIDVPDNYWAKNEIESFTNRGIISGYGNGKFGPADGVTREQFCKMLVLTFGAELTTPSYPSFSDVDASRWSYPYIEACKEFLTGYVNPFGGLPAFHPEDYATREDIAVALVRMMGLTANDAKDKNYAKWKFRDGYAISPSLVPYVSLACERGLMNGYPDGRFGPQEGITRAEAVVVLSRAMKQAFTDINSELDISARVIYGNNGKTATILIEAEEGTTVTVDDKKVSMSSNGYGKYEGSYTYTFESEGSRAFIVTGKKGTKTKSFAVEAKYYVSAPILTITQCPVTSDVSVVTIKGTVSDKNDFRPTVTINGQSVSVNYDGSFSHNINLTEGDNKITIVATNKLGKSTTIDKTIRLNTGAPILTITQCPTSSDVSTVTIKGKVTDRNDNRPTVSINGEVISVGYDGSFSKTITLTEGENKIKIVATNKLGKSATVERTVTFNIGLPVITLTHCPTSSDVSTVTIKGTVTDKNDTRPTVTINGQAVIIGYDGSFSQNITLTEGENRITIIATNKLGKSATVERTITFNIGLPVITLTQCPASSDVSTVTIKGTVTDKNDNRPTVTINGQAVSVGYDGSFSQNITLTEGENRITIIATNKLGKYATVERIVVFVVGSPEIVFTNCPEVTNQKNITIGGSVIDKYSDTKLYINDQEVMVGYGNKNFSKSVTLNEGDNVFIFKAVNAYGKSTTVVKTIKYVGEANPPALDVFNVPLETTNNTILVSGTVNDSMDPQVKVYVNDALVSTSNGSWSVTVSLNEGSNDITIVAINSFGKSTKVVKSVQYSAPVTQTEEQNQTPNGDLPAEP